MSKIILSGGGEMWGLPEISPFVTKTEIHLRMAGLDYTKRQAMPEESPKGQIPFIDDGGMLIGDSTFIRFHIEGMKEDGLPVPLPTSIAEYVEA